MLRQSLPKTCQYFVPKHATSFLSVRIAGDEINDCIQRYVQDEFKLLIGENMAEAAKMQIASAVPPAESMQFRVAGKNLVDGTPKSIVLTDAHVREAIREPVNAIVAAVRRALEKTPPELVADIATNGLLLAGGGALLKGLDKLITQESSLLVHINDDPCVLSDRDPSDYAGIYPVYDSLSSYQYSRLWRLSLPGRAKLNT